jgi:hypothetical protein
MVTLKIWNRLLIDQAIVENFGHWQQQGCENSTSTGQIPNYRIVLSGHCKFKNVIFTYVMNIAFWRV